MFTLRKTNTRREDSQLKTIAIIKIYIFIEIMIMYFRNKIC